MVGGAGVFEFRDSGRIRFTHVIAVPSESHQHLLRAALRRGTGAAEAWRTWRASADLDRLDPASTSLLPLVHRNLFDDDAASADRRFLQWLHRGVWAENMRRLDSAAHVLALLGAAGIETLLLKGAALTLTRYADAGLRPMVDVDILVRPVAAPAAMRVLQAHGWTPVGWAPFCRAPEQTVAVRHSHGFSRGTGEQVDLHWHVLWTACGEDDDTGFWQRARPAFVNGVATRVLAPCDQLLQACILGGRWETPVNLRWAADAVAVLSATDADAQVDWAVLVAEARERSVSPVVAAALEWLVREYDAGVPASVIAALRTARTPWLDRVRHRLESHPRGRMAAALLLALHQIRLARANGGWPLLGLPAYLLRTYEIDRVAQLRALYAHARRPRVTP